MTTPYLDDIKAHFDLTDFNEETDGLPINGHFVFIVPIASDNNSPVLLLSTSVCECLSQEDTADKLQAVIRLQQLFGDQGYALGLEPEERFFALQKIVFPDDANAACDAIEEFTRNATAAEQAFATASTEEN